MQALAKRIRSTRLLGPLSTQQLVTLLEETQIQTASAGDIIIHQKDPMPGHLILIDGEIEAQRVWSTPGKNDKSYTWTIRPIVVEGGFCFLGSANRIRARATTDVRYVFINAEKIDELIGWDEHFAPEFINNPELKRRMSLVKQVSIFYELPLNNIKHAFERMETRIVEAGETIVTQGDKGDCYYIIESGLCDVIQTDPFTDETKCVAKMGPGDAFGEEALLQNSYRNATVTMTSPGKLLTLNKTDFDELLHSDIVEEIAPDAAIELVKDNKAQWLDCRYDMEYEESRIPGAPLVSLGTLRKDIHQIDPERTYIVYCRSGRRSNAAVYLLRERNIKAMSLQGGMKNWPYEVDAVPL